MYERTIKPGKAIKGMTSDGAQMFSTGFRVGRKSLTLLDIAVDDFIYGAKLVSKTDRLEDLKDSFIEKARILTEVKANTFEAEFLAQAKLDGLID